MDTLSVNDQTRRTDILNSSKKNRGIYQLSFWFVRKSRTGLLGAAGFRQNITLKWRTIVDFWRPA